MHTDNSKRDPGHMPLRQPCNMLHGRTCRSSRAPCCFDRYTCRTKNAVTPFPSMKVRNLIDTLSRPTKIRIGSANTVNRGLPLGSTAPCYIRNISHQSPKSLDTPALQTLHISRHPCRDIFCVTPTPSTKLPKYLGTFSNLRRGCLSRAEHREARDRSPHPGPTPNTAATTSNSQLSGKFQVSAIQPRREKGCFGSDLRTCKRDKGQIR